MARVELGAEDQGSQKLIQYYTDLGFSSKMAGKVFGELSMDAPIGSVSAFAPQSWMCALPLDSFNAWPWLWGDAERPSLSSMINLMAAPDTWNWPVQWPGSAEMQIRTSWIDADAKATITAHLRSPMSELVYCRAVCRLKQESIRVIWLGNSGSKPVHACVRGRLLDGSLRSDSCGRNTVAVCVLGAVAAAARWFGTEILELTAMDDGCGKLCKYLQSLGFEQSRDSDSMSTSCRQFAQDYCPKAWRNHLPPDAHLAMLTKLCNS